MMTYLKSDIDFPHQLEIGIDLASREDIERRLVAAEKAKHDLLTGKSARVLVDGNGERIEFTAINAARLDSYIEDLKRQLGLSAPLGPMVVFY